MVSAAIKPAASVMIVREGQCFGAGNYGDAGAGVRSATVTSYLGMQLPSLLGYPLQVLDCPSVNVA